MEFESKGVKMAAYRNVCNFQPVVMLLKMQTKVGYFLGFTSILVHQLFRGVWAWCDTCLSLACAHVCLLVRVCMHMRWGGRGSDPLEAWCPIKGGQA